MRLESGFVGDHFFSPSVFDWMWQIVRMVGVMHLQRQGVQTSISPQASLPHRAFSKIVYLIDHSSAQHWIPSILKQLGEWVSDSDFSAHAPLKMWSGELFVLHWDQAQSFAVPGSCVSACDTKKSLSFSCARFLIGSSVFIVIIQVLTLARSSIACVSFRREPTA